MIDRHAVGRWQARQAKLLHDSYYKAWSAGVESYQPAPERDGDPAGAAAVLTLAGRRAGPYNPPVQPASTPRQRALAPALKSLNTMAVTLATLTPSSANLAAAAAAVGTGQITGSQSAALAAALAVKAYFASNEYRLAGGESVAWAGEQNGYGEAANAAGMLVVWQTAGDGRECDDCEALGALGAVALSELPTSPGEGGTECDVGCFPAGTIVSGTFEGGLHAVYTGKMVELETANGQRLTVTANHPVATPNGFVRAGSLREGDDVLSHGNQVRHSGTPQPKVDHQPAAIEDVLRALSKTRQGLAHALGAEDLYGDGALIDGNVHVVLPDRALLPDPVARRVKQLRDLILVPAAPHQPLLVRDRASKSALGRRVRAASRLPGSAEHRLDALAILAKRIPVVPCRLASVAKAHASLGQHATRGPHAPAVAGAQLFQGVSTTAIRAGQVGYRISRRARQLASSIPSRPALTFDRLGVGLHRRPLRPLRLGSAAQPSTGVTKPAGESRTADTRFLTELEHGFPGFVTPDKLIKIRDWHAVGAHVYDLQSPYGWLVAAASHGNPNGAILCANCRCSLEAVDEPAQPLDAGQQDTIGQIAAQVPALA